MKLKNYSNSIYMKWKRSMGKMQDEEDATKAKEVEKQVVEIHKERSIREGP